MCGGADPATGDNSVFESIIVRRHAHGEQIVDQGLLAETLLFYNNVHVVADRGLLIQLAQTIGQENLLHLLRQKYINLTYISENLATETTNENGVEVHRFVSFHVGNRKKARLSPREEIEELMERTFGRSRKTRTFVRHLSDLISAKKSTKYWTPNSGSITKVAEADLTDPGFVDASVRDIVQILLPGFIPPPGWYFRVIQTDNGFYIDSNYDFSQLNDEYHKIMPIEKGSLTRPFLIQHIFDARMDLQIASFNLAEVLTTAGTSKILQRKLCDILVKRDRNRGQIAAFQDIFLHDAYAIREAINSGDRSFAEFIVILEKGGRYKEWLRSLNPDKNIIEEYYRQITSSTWIETLPVKALRFAVSTISGIANPAAGVVLGAADSFILDRLRRGWKPHQFVNRVLKRFVTDN
jgi:hypothetical protein